MPNNVYQLSDDVAFLNSPKPYNLPPSRPAWNPYASIVAMVEVGAAGQQYRTAVDELEAADGVSIARAAVDDISALGDDDVRWLYSTFTFVCQKYVYGNPPEIRRVLPECIGYPWHALSQARGAPMALTYDALIINNWRLKDPSKPADIDNIDVALVVTGTQPEKGFALVHMAMEASAGGWPLRMQSLHEDILTSATPVTVLSGFLDETPKRVAMLTQLLGRMWKLCEHPDYWNVVRATLMGYSETAFPDGLRVSGHPDITAERKGGSGAQSPLMHCVDTFLGIDHRDVNVAASAKPLTRLDLSQSERIKQAIHAQQQLPAHALSFFAEQKKYMCTAHRERWFKRLDFRPTLRDLVIRYGDDECVKKYNTCIELLTKMRKVHQLIAHKYIAEKAVAVELDHVALATAGGGLQVAGTVSGGGGSNFVSLLSQSIAETAQSAIAINREVSKNTSFFRW